MFLNPVSSVLSPVMEISGEWKSERVLSALYRQTTPVTAVACQGLIPALNWQRIVLTESTSQYNYPGNVVQSLTPKVSQKRTRDTTDALASSLREGHFLPPTTRRCFVVPCAAWNAPNPSSLLHTYLQLSTAELCWATSNAKRVRCITTSVWELWRARLTHNGCRGGEFCQLRVQIGFQVCLSSLYKTSTALWEVTPFGVTQPCHQNTEFPPLAPSLAWTGKSASVLVSTSAVWWEPGLTFQKIQLP